MLIRFERELIAGEGTLFSPDAVEHHAAPLLQEVQRPRAKSIEVFHRGNRRHEISFRTTRRFEDHREAAMFWLDHALGTLDTQTVEISESAGGRTARRFLRSAACSAFAARILGCSVSVSYTVVAGDISDKE